MEKKKRKISERMKERNGITLVALVITIVILIILATVTINLALGEEGLIDRAQDAKDLTEQATREEQEQLDSTLNELDRIMGENQAEYTDIYPTLYEDGTLGFSSTQETIEGKTPKKTYENIRNLEVDVTLPDGNIPWSNEGGEITKVIFVDEIVPSNLNFFFMALYNLTSIENIENLNTSRVTSMIGMFDHCDRLTSIDLSYMNTSNVTNMSGMFESCTNLTDIEFGNNFDTSNVENMSRMFTYCSALEDLDLSKFNTSKVTDMSAMFAGCEKLNSITLNSFDTSKVTLMEAMFFNCSSLTNLDISSFDTLNVTSRNVMFRNCTGMQEILVGEGWTEPSEADKANMFTGCGVQSVTLKNSSDV